MTTQTILLNTDQFPIKETHVGFFASAYDGDIVLSQIVEAFYPHPDAPETLVISRLETRRIACEKINSQRAAAINLVRLADDNARNLYNK